MTEKDKLELMRRFEPFGREIPKDQVMSVIARVPTTDRRKGKWVNKEGVYGVAYCSECDYELRVNNTNFCPNCGADMRERSE